MSRIGNKPIAHGQKRMGIAEHDPVAGCSFRLRAKEIRKPPRAQLADEDCRVTYPQPEVEPRGIRLPEVNQAKQEPNCEWRTLDESDRHEAHFRILAFDCGNVIQRAERKPVVNPKKKNLERLQTQQ